MSNTNKPKSKDMVQRGNKQPDYPGAAAFVVGRMLDPFLQYGILANDWGRTAIETLGGTTLPRGPPLITHTRLDRLGLSPYRTILLSMSVASMAKQNFHRLTIMQETMAVGPALMVSAFNATMNTANSLLFLCAQTSASVNGEHFPQTPLLVGAGMFTVGLSIELLSELQRHVFKKDPANKGRVYTGGLWSLSRHVNYFGYTIWRAGYALAAGGWTWGVTVGALLAYEFTQVTIPMHQQYMEEKVSANCRTIVGIYADFIHSIVWQRLRAIRTCNTLQIRSVRLLDVHESRWKDWYQEIERLRVMFCDGIVLSLTFHRVVERFMTSNITAIPL